MSKHVSWCEIENFHTLRKGLLKYPHLLNGKNVVTYRAKVKLHGTNSGVRIDGDGTVTALSRTRIITPQSDNEGFAKWVDDRREAFSNVRASSHMPSLATVVYGEWFGPGIQKGVAASRVPERTFAAFAARLVQADDDSSPVFDMFTDPEELAVYIKQVPNAQVIPWYDNKRLFTIDWSLSSEELQPVLDEINDHVARVEACDPWIKERFGIEGVGEGLVFYPVSAEHQGYTNFSNLCFKAKGDKHKVVAHTKPAQADATVAAGAAQFAEMVVTDARLEQGVQATNTGDFNMRQFGDFVRWLIADVTKECQAELDAMDATEMDRKLAMKCCSDRARNWYMARSKK